MGRWVVIYYPAIYVAGSIVIYFIAPWNFDISNPYYIWYLLAVVLSIAAGSSLGGSVTTPPRKRGEVFDARMLFRFGLWTSFILYLPTVYARTGSFLPDVLWSIRHPSEAYERSLQAVFPAVEYLRILVAPLLISMLPLGFSLEDQLSRPERRLYWGYLILFCLMFSAMGVNRGIFEVLLGVGFCACLVRARAGNLTVNLNLVKLTLLVVLIGVGLAFFVKGQLNRTGSGAPIGYFPAAGLYSSLDPSEATGSLERYWRVLINQLSIYLVQGYYAGGLVFENWDGSGTFGFGYSDFLLRNAASVFGDDFLARSPVYAIEDQNGWLHGNYWFSIIPWIVSDVGYAGALLVFFGLAYMYSRAVSSYIRIGGHVNCIVAYVLFFLFLYFPANNYIFQSGESFVGAWFFLMLWLLFRGVGDDE